MVKGARGKGVKSAFFVQREHLSSRQFSLSGRLFKDVLWVAYQKPCGNFYDNILWIFNYFNQLITNMKIFFKGKQFFFFSFAHRFYLICFGYTCKYIWERIITNRKYLLFRQLYRFDHFWFSRSYNVGIRGLLLSKEREERRIVLLVLLVVYVSMCSEIAIESSVL